MTLNPGKFSVNRCYTIVPETAKQLVDIFKLLCLLPLKIEFDPFTDSYTYTGYSKEFNPVLEGEIIPEYTIIAETLEQEVISVHAELQSKPRSYFKGPIFMEADDLPKELMEPRH